MTSIAARMSQRSRECAPDDKLRDMRGDRCRISLTLMQATAALRNQAARFLRPAATAKARAPFPAPRGAGEPQARHSLQLADDGKQVACTRISVRPQHPHQALL